LSNYCSPGLLRNLETNIRYFNDKQGQKLIPNWDPTQEVFKEWDDPGWATDTDPNWIDPLDQKTNMQRMDTYTDKQPRPPGVTKKVCIKLSLLSTSTPSDTEKAWQANMKQGWYHRRKYTVALAEKEQTTIKFPGSTSAVSGNINNAGRTPVTSLDQILCAVSTMGQSRYKITIGEYNGWCMDGREAAYGTGFDWTGAPDRPTYKA
jgi:hypothetical protein